MKSQDGRFEYLTADHKQLSDEALPEQAIRFGFLCPRNQGSHVGVGGMCTGLLIRGRGHDVPKRTWEWDGNVDEPTFEPSINCGGCGWHGYIQKGVFTKTDRTTPETEQRKPKA